MSEHTSDPSAADRPRMDADIVCVGFGPATAAFLATLSKRLVATEGALAFESAAVPGLPIQVLCYERADDIGFGVSGIVTRARALRATYPEIERAGIPMSAPVKEEKVVYLLDPIGASRRSIALRAADTSIRATGKALRVKDHALELPWTPGFLHKTGGMVLSMGQFMQWVGAQVQSAGAVQVWPGTPVSGALIENNEVVGVRLLDQGVGKSGVPGDGYMPGMDIRAALTVVGDGPTGTVGQQLDTHFGMPEGHHARDWAVGMKFVVELPEDTTIEPGMVLHTFGFPEPEIFGFFYAHPDRMASVGIFVPSWFESPIRTAYRYLQHWMLHPYLWRYLKGAKLRSWGAKTLAESGRRGEPHLVGNGYARIGEGSGSTNVLTGSGVDEAWATGVQLAEAVIELLETKQPFSKENLEKTYVRRRRASWVEEEALVAESSRDGFQRGVVSGMFGMLLASLTKGRFSLFKGPVPPHQRVKTLEAYFRGRVDREELDRLRKECAIKGVSLHSMLMQRCGWPAIPYDGQLLMSHQDALLIGGKVQAPPGYADHVVFLYPNLCENCGSKVCVELCSGQAITPGPNGVPVFDREKCVFCGACQWNCAQPLPGQSERMNVKFQAGAGGLHSAQN
jgi:electron-transferring-flavoprotein dehydrogenase